MNEITIAFLTNSFFIWGIYVYFKEGMIFGKIGKWIAKEFPTWIYKPLIGCPPCMGFWWGMPGASLISDNLFQGFVYCTCMVGFNWLVSEFKSYFDE